MALDRKMFLAKIANKGEPAKEKDEKAERALDPIEVFRLAMHDSETFRAAFIEAVKSVGK
jgi:hypothetical protein